MIKKQNRKVRYFVIDW